MSDSCVRKDVWSYVLEDPVRILVADDDPILREFASVYLSTPTATITTAPDGMAALDLLRANPFDFAVLDIEMPVLDGFGLLERIRADKVLNNLPVMMLTGHEDIRSIDRAFKLGANGFSPKPVNWRLLSYQIRYVMRSCSLERQVSANEAAGESVKHALAEHKLLRERCEAILTEARRCLESTGELVPEFERASLQRIAKLASEVLVGDVFATASFDDAASPAPEAAREGRANAAA
jgi:DNA-binding response OmpR family regulator